MKLSLNSKEIFINSLKKLLIFSITFCVAISLLFSEIISAKESQLVIAYVERCSRFIDWPDKSKIYDKTKTFNLYIYKVNPFGEEIYKAFRIQKIKDKKVKIRIVKDLSELKDCHLLYVPPTSSSELKEIVASCQKANILTIAFSESYAEQGININFVKAKQNLKFEINTKSVNEAGLRISHLLLERAIIVK